MAESKVDSLTKGVFVLAVAMAVGAVLLDDATVGWVVGPTVLLMLCFVMSRVPLLYSLLGVMFCSLVLENPSEAPAAGMWQSPLYILGGLMLTHLNQTTQVSWMSCSGTDLLLIFLMGRTYWRHRSGIREGLKSAPVPKEIAQLVFLSLAGTAYVFVRGMLRNGDFGKSLWQMEKVTYLPILVLLFQVALRDRRDFLAVGKLILTAAMIRALLVIYIMNFADMGGAVPAWATTHHDSMLFACAVVILVSVLMHRARPDAWRLFWLTLPILVWGMVLNNRRTVWVQIILVFVTLYFSTPDSPDKRKIRKYLLFASPLILAYVAIGWGSPAGIFKPVQTLRSVVEPANDVSTMTRDIENYCIAKTIGAHPFLGLGYGHQFFQLISLPPMPYPLEPYLPHNSLLGLWFAAGFVGYTAMTLLWTAGVYFGVRAYRAADSRMDRTIALVCFGSVLIYLIQCYGDIGLGAPTGVYMVSASIAIAGKLAVSTGAWTTKAPPKKKKASAPRATLEVGLRRPRRAPQGAQ